MQLPACDAVRPSLSSFPTLQLFPSGEDSQIAIVACGHEDKELAPLGPMHVQNGADGVDACLVFDQDGLMGGEVGQCS